MEYVLGPIGAFLLFLVGLPLIGLAIGITMRVVLPYALGPVMVVLMVNLLGMEMAWWAPAVQVILSLIWILKPCAKDALCLTFKSRCLKENHPQLL